MSLDTIHKTAIEKMSKAVGSVEHEFSSLRTGRASVAIVDGVQVEAYGSKLPLKQVATISTPDAKTITIQPFDKSQTGAIERALTGANLGMNPTNDGKVIRLIVPQLTEERRKDLVKLAKKMAEEGRVSVRNIRRHANDEVKASEKDKKAPTTEDERERAMKKMQEITDSSIKEIDALLARKEKEMMEV
jgi:ribosome recycling factor